MVSAFCLSTYASNIDNAIVESGGGEEVQQKDLTFNSKLACHMAHSNGDHVTFIWQVRLDPLWVRVGYLGYFGSNADSLYTMHII